MRAVTLLFAMILLATTARAQQPIRMRSIQYTTNDLYQYNYTSVSPAFAGVDGTKLSFIGSIYVNRSGPYNGFGFIGFETPIQKINSGVGFSANVTAWPQRTFTDLNFMYNYQVTLDESRSIVFGAKLTSNQLAFDNTRIVPPDPNDPVKYYAVSTANTMLGGAAVLYKHKRMFAGLSVDNLVRTKYRLYNLFSLSGYHDKQLNLILGGSYSVGKNSSITHSAYVVNKNDFWRVDINNSIVFNNWLIAGLSLEVNNSDEDNQILPKANAGFNLKDKAQFVFSAYSEAYNLGGKKFSGQMIMVFKL